MAAEPKIVFIGAGSTVFMKNIVGDILQRPALQRATIALMDVNQQRLDDSAVVAQKLVATVGTSVRGATARGATARIETYTDQRAALDGADFVIVAFQIGGYRPATVTDFELPKVYGLRQTIGDTLGIGGIMRGLRTVPHLWSICEDMLEVCPEAVMLQYVNPMAINTWAMAEKFPQIRQVGLCHSVQGTAVELARDLDIDVENLHYKAAGINHVAFYLEFAEVLEDGTTRDLYPDLVRAYREGRAPKPNLNNPRCPNTVRYEMLTRLGYFVTESSEHFAEYTPWFIKRDRPDLIERFGIPLDEYPKRCVEQLDNWDKQAEAYRAAERIEVAPSHEYASTIINSLVTGEAAVVYGNVRNNGLITSLPDNCVVEVPCLVDRNGIQPTHVGALPPQLTAIMRSSINVQELTVAALINEDRSHIYQAAMMDPHTGAELDLDQIWSLTDDMLAAHSELIPAWARPAAVRGAAE